MARNRPLEIMKAVGQICGGLIMIVVAVGIPLGTVVMVLHFAAKYW